MTRLLAAVLALLAAPARAAALRLYNAGIDADPNGNIWHVTSKICNKADADTGSLLYELRLYPGDINPQAAHIAIGGRKYKPLQAHKCYDLHGSGFNVHTAKVPSGEYKVVLWVGEWNGSTFAGRPMFKWSRTYIKNP